MSFGVPKCSVYWKFCCLQVETETGQDLLCTQRCVLLCFVQSRIETEAYMALS